MTFCKMDFAQLSAELNRYTLQLIKQQENGQPMTEAQKKQFYALRKAWKASQADF